MIEQKKISYTIADVRQVSTNFEYHGSNTKVTTIFDAENVNPIELQRTGWQAFLDNFKKYVEEN